MIVWLSSFPRSGNTLLRLFCNQVFGLDSSTVFCKDSRLDIFRDSGFKRFESLGDIHRAWFCDDRIHLVKTHEIRGHPSIVEVTPKIGKAICVVRDGRATMVSYRHFLHDFESVNESLECLAGSTAWSQFLSSWDPLAYPNTLMLKYEDVLTDPQTAIKQLSGFLGISPIGQWNNDFESWHKMLPQFFRKGKTDAWRTEWTPELDNLFMAANGAWMRRLGYS